MPRLVKDHTAAGEKLKAIADSKLFQKEIASGQDPDAKSFATKTLPTVRAHLKAINSVAAAAPK